MVEWTSCIDVSTSGRSQMDEAGTRPKVYASDPHQFILEDHLGLEWSLSDSTAEAASGMPIRNWAGC